MMPQFDELTRRYTAYIENYLENNCLFDDGEPQKDLFAAMKYSLLAGGKRLRPIFVFDFCRMCGKDWKAAADFAAAVEMVHTYSLIHDDLPSMDNDDYRRGKPTNHKVYGEAMAILAGDALLTSAFSRLSSAPYPPEIRTRAVALLADCAGERGMVGGQVLDIQSENRLCTEREVLDIQTRKTGALIRAACGMGVLAGGGTEEQMDAAFCFADHLGLAFQIRDDMLDVIGNADVLGKATGVDTTKNTFVRLFGLDGCRNLIEKHTRKAKEALTAFLDHGYMETLATSLIDRNK